MKIANDVIISSILKGQKIFKINFLLAPSCCCNKNVSHSEKKYCYNFPLTTKTGKRSYCCGNITLSPEICILVTYWKEHIHSFWIFISFCRSFKRDFLHASDHSFHFWHWLDLYGKNFHLHLPTSFHFYLHWFEG